MKEDKGRERFQLFLFCLRSTQNNLYLKSESGKTKKVSLMSAVKYKYGIFDRNNFISVNEVHYQWLGKVLTHVQGWDVALTQLETYLRVVFHGALKKYRIQITTV